ncbi:MAG: RNA methyltransferase [Solobacterium sp.]|nr:RNA methyltransferase [Solobacterium sp.]
MMIVEGAIAVKACIQGRKRAVYKVYIDKAKRTKDFNYIRRLCESKDISVHELERSSFDNFEVGKTFGGVIAEVSDRRSDELGDGDAFYIDGIEDPFNIGYMLRTIYALGVSNVILKARDYSKLDAQIIKSSAGAYELLNIKYVDDEYTYLKSLKKNYHLYSLYRGDDSKDIFKVRFDFKCLFLIGGEKRGISSKLLSLVDTGLYIPYGNDFRNSLNAASAVSVVSTLLYGQRND